MKLSVLAANVEGRLQGPDGEKEVAGVSTIQDAAPDQVCYYGNRAYAAYLLTTEALAVISEEPVETSAPNLILVDNSYRAFREALLLFRRETPSGFRGLHETASIHPDAVLGDRVTARPGSVVDAFAEIGDGTVLGACSFVGAGTRIGRDCVIHPLVSIYHDCALGDRVTVHSGAVIGSDGFGFVPDPEGHLKVPQNGDVVIEDDVEIGAGSTIDRAVVGSTVIGSGSKLDNLVHVAHNVRMGSGCLIAAQTGIAGSTTIGSGVTFGGQAGINGHITIGDGAVIAAQAGVMKSVPPNATVSGYPAREHGESLRINAALMDLPDFRRTVLEFMKDIGAKEQDCR